MAVEAARLARARHRCDSRRRSSSAPPLPRTPTRPTPPACTPRCSCRPRPRRSTWGCRRDRPSARCSSLSSGTARSLVVSADVRTGFAGSTEEAMQGDAAAAFVVGSDDDGPLVAELVGSASVTDEHIERWRAPGELRTKVWDERFSEIAGRPARGRRVERRARIGRHHRQRRRARRRRRTRAAVGAGNGREARRRAGDRRPARRPSASPAPRSPGCCSRRCSSRRSPARSSRS